MQGFLTAAAVLYLLAGLVVYAVTDTTSVAGKIERHLPLVPYGVVNRNLFLFVWLAWPLWLLALRRASGP